MAVIFQNRTTNSSGTTPVVASTDTTYQILVSGVFGGADVYLMVVQDALRPAPMYRFSGEGMAVLDLKAGSSWYLVVVQASLATNIDASYL